MTQATTGAPHGVLPSVVFLYDREPSALLRQALDRIRSHRGISYHEIKATASTCECFQRVRVPALLLYNAEGSETGAAVGSNSIVSLIEQQF